MNYSIGDKCVHLTHGVGKVAGIESREFKPGIVSKFYIIEIEDGGTLKKVFMPVESAHQRLRPIITKLEAKQIYKILAKKTETTIDHQTWNRRYREYMELIHTGDIKQIALVFKALINKSDLSFDERKLLEQAKQLIIKELSIAEGLNETTIEANIEAALK